MVVHKGHGREYGINVPPLREQSKGRYQRQARHLEVFGKESCLLIPYQHFATTFCDLRNHKAFDVVPGKSEKNLEAFLSRLQGRE